MIKSAVSLDYIVQQSAYPNQYFEIHSVSNLPSELKLKQLNNINKGIEWFFQETPSLEKIY